MICFSPRRRDFFSMNLVVFRRQDFFGSRRRNRRWIEKSLFLEYPLPDAGFSRMLRSVPERLYFFPRSRDSTSIGFFSARWISPDVVSIEYSLPSAGILSDAERCAGGTVLCHSAGISFQLNIFFWDSRWRRDV